MTSKSASGALGGSVPFWGKTPEAEPYPLLAHLFDTYLTAGAVWDQWLRPGLRAHIAGLLAGGDEDHARALVQLAAGLHDVGKANMVFQTQAGDSRALSWRSGHETQLARAGLDSPAPALVSLVRGQAGAAARRHEYVGYQVLSGTLPDGVSDVGAAWLPHVVAGHHGRWINAVPDGRMCVRAITAGGWHQAQQELRQVVEVAAGLNSRAVSPVDPTRSGQAVLLVTGLVILADWLASQDRGCVDQGRAHLRAGIALGPAWLDARRDELTRLTLATLGNYYAPKNPQSAVLGAHRPRPLQSTAIERASDPGLWMVAYPTGEGKTEAALLRHMGHDEEGLIFALPTRATTNAMQDRLARIFADTGNHVVLSHQLAAAQAVPTPGAAHHTDWYDSSIRRLVAPVTTATCDQVLAGALRGRHAALRLLALSNHHVVLDEVHTYDQYQSQLLIELLHWWGATDTRVTLLSATLPAWQQREFENAYRGSAREPAPTMPYPSVRTVTAPAAPATTTPGDTSAVQPDLCTTLIDTDHACALHANWARQARQAHPNAHLLIIVNTVDRATAVARALTADPGGAHLMCLHSRMKAGHRAALEETLLSRTGPGGSGFGPVTLVATQVVEASLDVDFDLASTDLCPAPSLVQRAGRVWRFRDAALRQARFGGDAPPDRVLRVIANSSADESLPYLQPELARVRDHLRSHPRIRIPDDVQTFVDETTFDIGEWSRYAQTASDAELGHAMVRLEAAQAAKAQLTADILKPRRGCRHQHLVTLTGRDMTEDLMGTRFADRPSGMYLLVDSLVPIQQMATSRKACAEALKYSVPASGTVNDLLAQAHQITMSTAGLAAWEPATRMVAAMLPVAKSHLPDVGLTYDPLLGLIQESEQP